MLDLISIDLETLNAVVEKLNDGGDLVATELAEKLEAEMRRQRYGTGEGVACVDGRVPKPELEAYNRLRKLILINQNALAHAALRELVCWEPEYVPPAIAKDIGNKRVPFISEAFLYPLLGKDDARGLLCRISSLCEAFGTNSRELGRK